MKRDSIKKNLYIEVVIIMKVERQADMAMPSLGTASKRIARSIEDTGLSMQGKLRLMTEHDG